MKKSFRFLLNFAWVNLGAILGFIAVVIAGCYVTGTTDNIAYSGLFANYYAMLPTFILLCLFLYAMALCTNNLNLGLAMGARRADFFWAIQGIILFYTAAGWALQRFLAVFPAVSGWVVLESLPLLVAYGGRPWTFPLLCVVLLVLGCLLGLLMVRHRVLTVIIITLSVLIMMGNTMFMILSAQTNITVFFMGLGWGWLFTTLPKILPVVLIAATVGGELLMWRAIQTYTVR